MRGFRFESGGCYPILLYSKLDTFAFWDRAAGTEGVQEGKTIRQRSEVSMLVKPCI